MSRFARSLRVLQLGPLFGAAFSILHFSCARVPTMSRSVTRDPVGLDLGHKWLECWQTCTGDAATQFTDGPARGWDIVEGEVGSLLEIYQADERDSAGTLHDVNE